MMICHRGQIPRLCVRGKIQIIIIPRGGEDKEERNVEREEAAERARAYLLAAVFLSLCLSLSLSLSHFVR